MKKKGILAILIATIVLISFNSCGNPTCISSTGYFPPLKGEKLAAQRSYGLMFYQAPQEETYYYQDTMIYQKDDVKIFLVEGKNDTLFEIAWFKETNEYYGQRDISYNILVQGKKGTKFLSKEFIHLETQCHCEEYFETSRFDPYLRPEIRFYPF